MIKFGISTSSATAYAQTKINKEYHRHILVYTEKIAIAA
jgi:hypothetical protein